MVVEIDLWLVTKVPASHRIKIKHEEILFLSMASGFKQSKKNPKASVIAGVTLKALCWKHSSCRVKTNSCTEAGVKVCYAHGFRTNCLMCSLSPLLLLNPEEVKHYLEQQLQLLKPRRPDWSLVPSSRVAFELGSVTSIRDSVGVGTPFWFFPGSQKERGQRFL